MLSAVCVDCPVQQHYIRRAHQKLVQWEVCYNALKGVLQRKMARIQELEQENRDYEKLLKPVEDPGFVNTRNAELQEENLAQLDEIRSCTLELNEKNQKIRELQKNVEALTRKLEEAKSKSLAGYPMYSLFRTPPKKKERG